MKKISRKEYKRRYPRRKASLMAKYDYIIENDKAIVNKRLSLIGKILVILTFPIANIISIFAGGIPVIQEYNQDIKKYVLQNKPVDSDTVPKEDFLNN